MKSRTSIWFQKTHYYDPLSRVGIWTALDETKTVIKLLMGRITQCEWGELTACTGLWVWHPRVSRAMLLNRKDL